MMQSIKSRLAVLENAVMGKPIPSEREFWRQWETFDPLTKSLFVAVAELKTWETETDNHTRKYFETVSEFLINAGIAHDEESVLELAAELDGEC